MLDNYYLGIDGGGSKTAFTIVDENGKIVFESLSSASAIDTLSLKEIENSFLKGTRDFNSKVNKIFAGIGGVSSKDDEEKIKKILANLPISNKNTQIEVKNDVYSALYGALSNDDGIILIAGTGSVAFGKHNDKYVRCGGYCYQEGDPGSAYDLGRKALQHLAKVIDGREKESEFSKALMESINCNDFESLAKFMVKAQRKEVASLAKIVTLFENDEYARKIMINGVEEVLLMITSCYRQLDFKEKARFSIIGSLGLSETFYNRYLIQKINEFDKLEYSKAVFTPSLGSALHAKGAK